MATAKTSVKDVPLGIEATVMALRETLMDYFKSSSTTRFVNSQVWCRDESRGARYNYERRRVNLEAKCKIGIEGVHLLSVQKMPNVLTFRNSRFDRSPELQAVKKGVEEFLSKYLKGVEVKYTGEYEGELLDDSGLVCLSTVRDKREGEYVNIYSSFVPPGGGTSIDFAPGTWTVSSPITFSTIDGTPF